MHIIPKEGVGLLSTKLSSGVDGFLDEYKESVASGEGRRSTHSGSDSHPVLDEKVKRDAAGLHIVFPGDEPV